jgi:hypothetical protein
MFKTREALAHLQFVEHGFHQRAAEANDTKALAQKREAGERVAVTCRVTTRYLAGFNQTRNFIIDFAIV